MTNTAHADGVPTLRMCSAWDTTGPSIAFTLYQIPGLTGVVSAAVGSALPMPFSPTAKCCHGVPADTVSSAPRRSPSSRRRAQPRMRSNTPQPVAVKFDAVDVSAKGEHVLALARDGGVYAWGRGDAGQLGIGAMPVDQLQDPVGRAPRTSCPIPVRIPDLTDVVAISAGNMHSLALLKDGTVRAWGENKWGQVGDGSTVNRDTPTPVPGVRNAVAIAATRLLLSGRLVGRHGHGVGRDLREQQSADRTGAARRRARHPLGGRRRRSRRGAHTDWRV